MSRSSKEIAVVPLDRLVGALLLHTIRRQADGPLLSISDTARALSSLGLTRVEIAHLMGKPTKYIATVTGRRSKKDK